MLFRNNILPEEEVFLQLEVKYHQNISWDPSVLHPGNIEILFVTTSERDKETTGSFKVSCFYHLLRGKTVEQTLRTKEIKRTINCGYEPEGPRKIWGKRMICGMWTISDVGKGWIWKTGENKRRKFFMKKKRTKAKSGLTTVAYLG